jgi:hypothetical protein
MRLNIISDEAYYEVEQSFNYFVKNNKIVVVNTKVVIDSDGCHHLYVFYEER